MPKKKKLLTFDRDKFLTWREQYWWKPLDDVIYDFFRQPNEKNILRSKINLLTYVYQANIEKKASIIEISDNLLASPEFQDAAIRLSKDPLNNATFFENTEIYSIHRNLMEAIRETTQTNESVFVSKFLHFWKPQLFPILDSKAEGNLMAHEWTVENLRDLESGYERYFPEL